eukprot:6139183-Amphidinium_carterae.1
MMTSVAHRASDAKNSPSMHRTRIERKKSWPIDRAIVCNRTGCQAEATSTHTRDRKRPQSFETFALSEAYRLLSVKDKRSLAAVVTSKRARKRYDRAFL